jgi:beta-glucosidase
MAYVNRLAVLGILAATTAVAAPDEHACQTALVRAGRQVVARSTAPSTRAVATRLARRIRTACSGDVASIVRGGDCAGARTAPDLAACIAETHAEYGAAVVTAARACGKAGLRRVRAFALARLALLQRCKRRPPAGLAPGADCTVDPTVAARIEKLRLRADCPDADAVVTTGGDAVVAAEFPDRSFCGDGSAAVEARIDALLPQMTLADKIAQMHGVSLFGISHTAPNPGLGIPGMVMVDGARGVGITLGNATSFPVGMARGATWDPALETRVGDAIGTEARAKGAAVLLAPVLNILRHPRWGRAQETYGEDTFHLGRMGVGFVRGVQDHILANPKHFAANSIENTRFAVDVSVDERTLREVYLPHFRAAVQEGHSGSVMSAYNKVNGQYCGENVHLLHDVLKGDWGFQGFVESDWVFGTRSTVPAITAGLDIEMPFGHYYGDLLAQAVAAGDVDEAAVDAAVRRILRAQLCFRLDTDPPVTDPTQVGTPAHLDLARDVERESIVLLKNAGTALPFDRAALGSLVVVGDLAARPNLGDLGSSTVIPTSAAVVPLDGIRAAAGAVPVTQVTSMPLSPEDQAAVAAADAAIVVAGLTSDDEGEGAITIGDRASLVLPRDQDALIAAVAALNPRTIVVLQGSGAVLMPWLDDVAAVLEAWYPGQEGGTAIGEVLFGDVNPSGKLPVSFPRAEADLPPFDNVSFAVSYGYFHGYRWLDRNGVAPLFPFGFGLSYTSFAYANLRVAPATLVPWGRVSVSADVTNTGARAGDEIAELYMSYEGSSVDRAVRDLKGFARVHLEPGETKAVTFDVRAVDLAFWDAAAGAWSLEPIRYGIHVGPSSRDLPLEGAVTVAP